MTEPNSGKLNRLQHLLPEGLVVDAAWLSEHGYSTSLRSQYVAAGWLEQPARRVYRRPRGVLSWQQVVISLQTLLGRPLLVGGRTALELQGYAHYLPAEIPEIHLHGPQRPPGWLAGLPLRQHFVYRNSTPLFGEHTGTSFLPPSMLTGRIDTQDDRRLQDAGLRVMSWGQWDWPLIVSTPERAVVELLDEVPDHESFHQVDMLVEGLVDLAPRRIDRMLNQCRSVKAKRLFFFFADRHAHAWLDRLDRVGVNLGAGKRSLAKGGVFDPTYRITVPEDLAAPRR